MQKLLHPSRLVIAVLAIAAMGIGFVLYARDATSLVLTVILQELLIQGTYLAVCLLLGRTIIRRLIPQRVESMVGVVSAMALGLGLIGFAVLGLGLAGRLSPTTAWGIPIAAAVLGLLDAKHLLASLSQGAKQLMPWLKSPSNGGWLWLVAALLFAIPLIGATLPAGMLWRPDDPHPYDSLIYHLQVPREWFELGRVVPLEHNVYSYFPLNVEIHYLLASYLRGTPWLAVTQNQFLSTSFTLLAAAGLWGSLRIRVEPRAASLATVALLCVPWVLMTACITYVESGMLLFTVLAITWFLDAITATGHSYRQFILAGMFAGLASGTKLTAVAMVLMALPATGILCFALPAVRQGQLKRLLLGSIVFGMAALATLSPWLIRNEIWVGNPVFPNAMRQLGQGHYSDVQVERWERAHRPAADVSTAPARLGRAASEIFVNWRFSYVLLPLALLGALLAWRRPEAWMLLLLIILMLGFWITATHLMGRFFILAVIPGAMLIALLPRWLFYPAAILIAAAGFFAWIGPTLPAPETAANRNLHTLFATWAESGRKGAYGLQDYRVFVERFRSRMELAREVVFVGGGQIFYYQVPMDKVHYRTVFDINQAGRNAADAYYGPPPQQCPTDALVIFDVAEADRLANTYWQVPRIAPELIKQYSHAMTVEP